MLSTDQGMGESVLGRMFEGIPAGPARTRLEAYRDLILRWRREGRTYREIQTILRERCDLKAAYGPLYRFVQRQSRPRKVQPEPEPITIGLPVQAKPPVASGQRVDRWAAERERMRKHKEEPASTATPEPKRFEYTDEDASKPFY